MAIEDPGNIGGAADILNDDPPAQEPPADAPPGDAPPAADDKWLEQFSADGGDADNPSNRDWLTAKGFKTADDLIKSYREAEHTIRNGGKLLVAPGDDAKPEEIAAFHKAIGVPEKPEDYAINLPEGVQEDEVDMDLLGTLKGTAHEAGVPAKAFDKLVNSVIAAQADSLAASAKAETDATAELHKEWGTQKDAKMANVNNAMRALDLKRSDVAAIQRGFAAQYGEPGSRKTLELLQKLGAGVAEDALLGGDGPRRFGITGAQAQVELDKLTADTAFAEKIAKKDPEAVARYDRLIAAVAADREQKQRAAAAG